MSFLELTVTPSTSLRLIFCCELVSIHSSFSCFGTPAFGSVGLSICAELGISFISLFSLITHVLQCFSLGITFGGGFSVSHSYKGPAIILSFACLDECQMDHSNFFVAMKTSEAILTHDGNNCIDVVYLILLRNAKILISSSLTSSIFCLVICFFLLTGVDISVKT